MDLLNLATVCRQKVHKFGGDAGWVAPSAAAAAASSASSCTMPVHRDLSTSTYYVSGSHSGSSISLGALATADIDDTDAYSPGGDAGREMRGDDRDFDAVFATTQQALRLKEDNERLRDENQRLRARLAHSEDLLAERNAAVQRLQADVADLEEARALYRDQLAQLCNNIPVTANDNESKRHQYNQDPCEHYAQTPGQQQQQGSPSAPLPGLQIAPKEPSSPSCATPPRSRVTTNVETPVRPLPPPRPLSSLPECEGDGSPGRTLHASPSTPPKRLGTSNPGTHSTAPCASPFICRTVSCSARSLWNLVSTPRYLPGDTDDVTSVSWQQQPSSSTEVRAPVDHLTDGGYYSSQGGDAGADVAGQLALPSPAEGSYDVAGRVTAARRNAYTWRRSVSCIVRVAVPAPRLGGVSSSGGLRPADREKEREEPLMVVQPLRRPAPAPAVSMSTFMMSFNDSF